MENIINFNKKNTVKWPEKKDPNERNNGNKSIAFEATVANDTCAIG